MLNSRCHFQEPKQIKLADFYRFHAALNTPWILAEKAKFILLDQEIIVMLVKEEATVIKIRKSLNLWVRKRLYKFHVVKAIV